MRHNIVDNAVLGTNIPQTNGTTEVQVYRCTDNKIFKPTCLTIANPDSAAHTVYLSDADLTDSGEDTHKAKKKFAVHIAAGSTAHLEGDELGGLAFRYGVCAFLDAAASANECEIYVAGYEV